MASLEWTPNDLAFGLDQSRSDRFEINGDPGQAGRATCHSLLGNDFLAKFNTRSRLFGELGEFLKRSLFAKSPIAKSKVCGTASALNCCNYISRSRCRCRSRSRSRLEPIRSDPGLLFSAPPSKCYCRQWSGKSAARLVKLIGENSSQKARDAEADAESRFLSLSLSVEKQSPLCSRVFVGAANSFRSPVGTTTTPMNLDIFPIINKPENYRKRTSPQLILQLLCSVAFAHANGFLSII